MSKRLRQFCGVIGLVALAAAPLPARAQPPPAPAVTMETLFADATAKEAAVRFPSEPDMPFGHSKQAHPYVLRFGSDPTRQGGTS